MLFTVKSTKHGLIYFDTHMEVENNKMLFNSKNCHCLISKSADLKIILLDHQNNYARRSNYLLKSTNFLHHD